MRRRLLICDQPTLALTLPQVPGDEDVHGLVRPYVMTPRELYDHFGSAVPRGLLERVLAGLGRL